MVRLSRQTKRRAVSFRRPKSPHPETGPKKDNLPKGYKEHKNAVQSNAGVAVFIPQMKTI